MWVLKGRPDYYTAVIYDTILILPEEITIKRGPAANAERRKDQMNNIANFFEAETDPFYRYDTYMPPDNFIPPADEVSAGSTSKIEKKRKKGDHH